MTKMCPHFGILMHTTSQLPRISPIPIFISSLTGGANAVHWNMKNIYLSIYFSCREVMCDDLLVLSCESKNKETNWTNIIYIFFIRYKRPLINRTNPPLGQLPNPLTMTYSELLLCCWTFQINSFFYTSHEFRYFWKLSLKILLIKSKYYVKM